MQPDKSTSSPDDDMSSQLAPAKLSLRVIKVLRYSREGRPECFDSDRQWQLWVEPARIAPPEPSMGVCEDCTQEYQAKMTAQGRCVNPNLTVGVVS
jgi:hypothetical protein